MYFFWLKQPPVGFKMFINDLWYHFIGLLPVPHKVIGVLLVSFPCRWHTICKILQPIGRNCWFLKKCPKPCWPIRRKEKTNTENTRCSCNQHSVIFTSRNMFISMEIGWAHRKFKNQTQLVIVNLQIYPWRRSWWKRVPNCVKKSLENIFIIKSYFDFYVFFILGVKRIPGLCG